MKVNLESKIFKEKQAEKMMNILLDGIDEPGLKVVD
jgi:hypothetical protein